MRAVYVVFRCLYGIIPRKTQLITILGPNVIGSWDKEQAMADIALSSQNLAQTIRNQAWRIWEDALYCSAGHFQESRWWQGINLWMGIPTTIIAAITGITSLADSGSSPLIPGRSSNLIVPVLSFTVAAISGLSTFLDPTGQASKHYQAAS